MTMLQIILHDKVKFVQDLVGFTLFFAGMGALYMLHPVFNELLIGAIR